ncbi:MAG: hypothetical protein K2G21_09140 [Muribaculaceae bacterium]|nr:hypothetical protein [Muribaculaceae bacterium]
MKQFCLVFMLLMSTMASRGFTVIGGEGLEGDRLATLVIDFSESEVEGLPLDDFLEDVNQTLEFKNEISEYYADFIKRFNDRCKSIALTRVAGKPITLTVKVVMINRKGNEALCHYVFSDTATGSELLTESERTREGRIGSFSNLVGDVIREAGGDFGRFITKYLKDKNKKSNYTNTDPIYE